jgi:tol-pal system protein YbgF
LPACLVDRAARRELSDLRQQTETYRRTAEAADRRAATLEDRLFVLEDRVDTQAVAADREDGTPRLPVVRRAAPPQNDPPTAEPLAASPVQRYTDSSGDEVEVVYEGEAARPGARAVIRLDESGQAQGDDVQARVAPRRARRGLPAADPVPLDGGDRLPVTPRVGPGRPTKGEAEDPIGLYKRSYQAVTARDHATAITGFARFIELYPRHDYADNAQYWLGEAYYDQKDWQTAIEAFQLVVKRYPDGNKAPDALLKVGYCHAKMGDVTSARDVLSQVIEIYPKTEAAGLAARRLEELRQ